MQVCWTATAVVLLLVLGNVEAKSVETSVEHEGMKTDFHQVIVPSNETGGELIIKPMRDDDGELVIMPKSDDEDERVIMPKNMDDGEDVIIPMNENDGEFVVMPKQYSLGTAKCANVALALTPGIPANFSYIFNTLNSGTRWLISSPIGSTLQLISTLAVNASTSCAAGLFQISAGGQSLSSCGIFGTFGWTIKSNKMEVLGVKWSGGHAGRFNCSVHAIASTTTKTSTTKSTTTTTTTTPTTTTTTPTTTTTTTTTPTTTTTTPTTTTTTTTTPTTTTTTPTTTSTTTTTPTTTTTTTTTPTTTTTKATTSTSATVTCRCGRKNPIVRIVGGVATTTHEYPWQVGLVSTTGTKPFCGGSIISNQYILTAAHCVEGTSAGSIRVVVGEHNTASTTETTATKYISAQSITIHPGYNSNTMDNDLALIKLSQPITFPADNKVAPICLPPAGNTYDNVQATVTGWGTTSEGGSLSNILQEVTIPTMTNTKCKELLGATAITANMLCAGPVAGGKDSCQGDSGGPLTTSGGTNYQVLIGIVSWGYGCARPNEPGVYTRVNNYLSWINTNIAGSKTCPPP